MAEGVAYDENFEKAAFPVAAKLGLTPFQVKGLIDFYAGWQGTAHKAFAEAGENAKREAAQKMEEAVGGLRKEWGQAFQQNDELGTRAATHFGGEKIVGLIQSEASPALKVELSRLFARIGKQMGEDALKGDGSGLGNKLTPAEAQAEVSKLMATEAYRNKDHPEHQQAVDKALQLRGLIHDNTLDVRRGVNVANITA